VAGKKVRLDNARVPDYVRAFLIQEKAQTEKNIRQQARRDQWDPSQLHRELRARETDIQAEKDKLYPFVLPGISFDLKIRVKDTARYLEVKKAVKAFLLFGAVGGRGRRGYGSIDSIEMEGDLQSAKLTDSALWFSSLPNPLPTGLVSLCGARVFVGKPMPSAFEAWEAGVKIFHHFRKAELPGSSRPSRGLPSHTTWPEADMLRQLLRPPVARHNPAFAGETAFPRAQLGLPLKFQSQRSHAGAFGDAELYLEVGGKEIHRLASPVIIKPLKLNDKWHPAILILNSSAVRAGDLRLTTDSGARPTVDASGAPAGLFDGRNNVPFSHSHSSVLDVLADYLEKHAHWTATEVSAL
jgi:CRISPR/Cas system CMR-associated protein Cmr1 (group 7 of RAMP superfamily)